MTVLEARDVPSVVYDSGFQGATSAGSQWSARAASGAAVTPGISTTPLGNRQFLGQFGNSTATLSLNSLPSHNTVTISFDLYVINSWDGSDALRKWGPDGWSFAIDGHSQLSTTFSNQPLASPGAANNVQSFGGQGLPAGTYPAFTGAAEVNTLGYTFYRGSYQRLESMDSVYRFEFTVPHIDDSVRFDFLGFGLQGLADESWGLDNVRVTADELPAVVSLSEIGGLSQLEIPKGESGCFQVTWEDYELHTSVDRTVTLQIVQNPNATNPAIWNEDYILIADGQTISVQDGQFTVTIPAGLTSTSILVVPIVSDRNDVPREVNFVVAKGSTYAAKPNFDALKAVVGGAGVVSRSVIVKDRSVVYPGTYGTFVWPVVFELRAASDKTNGGWIVQHVTRKITITSPKDFKVPDDWDYWEAWRIEPGKTSPVATTIPEPFRQAFRNVNAKVPPGLKAHDWFASSQIPGTTGNIAFTGEVYYLDNMSELDLPKEWIKGNEMGGVSEAGGLRSILNAGNEKAITAMLEKYKATPPTTHNITVQWVAEIASGTKVKEGSKLP